MRELFLNKMLQKM